jgi:hypothetical protein
MAAVAVTIGLQVLQGFIAAIPGGIAVWQAIVAMRAANPGMTDAQALTLMQNITGVISTLGADEVAQLALIPPAPVPPPVPVA